LELHTGTIVFGGSSEEANMQDRVTLRAVDSDNVEAVIDLSVAESQTDFVAPNVYSLAEAFAATKVWVRAIYAEAKPVGFLMLSDDDEKPRYYLWRFMIDAHHQGKGYGSDALELVHDYVRSRPGGTEIYLSYVPEEGGPEHFYKKYGYQDTGRIEEGEHEAVKQL
jgi:diamine N-acetyltransferase